MVKSSIFKIYTTNYIHNFSYAKILSENAIRKVSNTIVCIPDLVIIKYVRYNTIEIK